MEIAKAWMELDCWGWHEMDALGRGRGKVVPKDRSVPHGGACTPIHVEFHPLLESLARVRRVLSVLGSERPLECVLARSTAIRGPSQIDNTRSQYCSHAGQNS